VVYPEVEMGSAVAHLVNLRTISDFMPLAIHYGVAKLIAPPFFLKRSLANLGFGPGGKWDVSVLIMQRGKDVIVTPGRAEIVKPGDIIIVSGADDKLEGLLAEAEKTRPNE
jgi:trk system potassium uptake protein TrkA